MDRKNFPSYRKNYHVGVAFTVRFPREIADKLAQLAVSKNTSKTQIVREAIINLCS